MKSRSRRPSPSFTATIVPILNVRDFREAVNYFTRRLRFELKWDSGQPATFGCVALGRAEIFLCEGGQGGPGTWMSVFLDDVDEYARAIRKRGAKILRGPVNEPWGMREMHVQDPNGHVLRFGHGIPSREPKLPIRRVALGARIEERLAGVLRDLARDKGLTVGEALEETLLHTFERLPTGGVASPHTEGTLARIPELKRKHGLDYDCHASYRFVEEPRKPRRRKSGK